MPTTVDLTIAPNDKYRRVIGDFGMSDADDDSADTADNWEDWPDEHKQAADGYAELLDNAWSPAEYDSIDETDFDILTWDDISPASDPDLLAKIATYFEGMAPDEPAGRLEAKCRLLNVEVYADAQLAAREELRDN